MILTYSNGFSDTFLTFFTVDIIALIKGWLCVAVATRLEGLERTPVRAGEVGLGTGDFIEEDTVFVIIFFVFVAW